MSRQLQNAKLTLNMEKILNNKFFIVLAVCFLIVSAIIGYFWLKSDLKKKAISNFEECAVAGNPVMESYPRRCSANGQTFTEEIKPSEGEINDSY